MGTAHPGWPFTGIDPASARTAIKRVAAHRALHESLGHDLLVDIVYRRGYVVRVARLSHSKKEIEKALRQAEAAGLMVTDAKGHGHSSHVIAGDEPHPFRVWSTPKNVDNHAKQIRRHIRRNT